MPADVKRHVLGIAFFPAWLSQTGTELSEDFEMNGRLPRGIGR